MIIDKLLASGIKLWLRSQLTDIERLQVKINGRDKDIMTGYIPEVIIAANTAKYRLIALSQIEIIGNNIRLNLTEIIQAKPFRLLEPILVKANIILSESDLQNSLASPLFLEGLQDFWWRILQTTNNPNLIKKFKTTPIKWQEFSLEDKQLTLSGISENDRSSLTIITDLKLFDPQTLLFAPIEVIGIPELASQNFPRLTIDLGNDVVISQLISDNKKLLVAGEIKIMPNRSNEHLTNLSEGD